MKKFTMLFVAVMTAFVFSSCKDKEDEPTSPTTIQVVNNYPYPTTSSFSCDFTETFIKGYDSAGDLIQTELYTSPIYIGGTSAKVTLLDEVVKVRIEVDAKTNYGSWNSYTQTYYYTSNTKDTQTKYWNTYFLIEAHQNNVVNIDNLTY